MKVGKRLRAAYGRVEHEKIYSLSEAVALVKQNAMAKFDETVELALVLNIDATKTDQHVRGVAMLPHGTGKQCRVAVFARAAQADEAKEAGADVVGAEDLVEAIQKGELNFDRCVATPDLMPLVSRVAKILGPRGLMPSPKVGTVTVNVGAAVKVIKGGQVEFRSEKGGIIHAGVGKASFEQAALEENVRFFVNLVRDENASLVKGTIIKRLSLSSTMGAGVKFAL
ncbi:MAG: 50S ribosomal protein L1 [Holosporales bacterium]|jgi:large subunit ribosomal protein L1|nr:50S ribosomal protein L1 [Holosporales bacterium]